MRNRTSSTENSKQEQLEVKKKYIGVPIAVSNRHVHLTIEHVEALFGKGYQLNKMKDLSQPGQFACKETVKLIGPKGSIDQVRILGPARQLSQVEVSLSDGHTLGINPPIRNSGEINGTPPIKIQGPMGEVKLKNGLICAARHIHMHPTDAELYNVRDRQIVSVKVDGVREVTFHNVLIRVSDKYKLEMHIDFDEANAAYIRNGVIGKII